MASRKTVKTSPAVKASVLPETAENKAAGLDKPVMAYVLRIELRDFKPTIWREVQVPPTITLRKLHAVIQAAMGWENDHLYGFAVPGTGRAGRYWSVPPNRRFEPRAADSGMGFFEPANSDATQALDGLLQEPKDKLLYLYDFGDDWEHVITLRGSTESAQPLPYLSAGQGGCPPEDCGGLAGFEQMIEVWKDPSHPEREDMVEWLQEMGITGEPGTLDAAGWAALQKAVERLRPRKAAAKKQTKAPVSKRVVGKALPLASAGNSE